MQISSWTMNPLVFPTNYTKSVLWEYSQSSWLNSQPLGSLKIALSTPTIHIPRKSYPGIVWGRRCHTCMSLIRRKRIRRSIIHLYAAAAAAPAVLASLFSSVRGSCRISRVLPPLSSLSLGLCISKCFPGGYTRLFCDMGEPEAVRIF